jgi:hypothetical protein
VTERTSQRFTAAVLREARARVQEVSYRQFHLNQAGITEAAWLPAGAWAGCRGPVDLTPREIIVGVDIGGSGAASALVGVTADLQVPICEVSEGNESVLAVTDAVLRLQADGWVIRELDFDPWLTVRGARLEREHGIVAVEFPQSHARMTVASEGLHAAIVEQRLRHPGHDALDRHVAAAVARRPAADGAWTR